MITSKTAKLLPTADCLVVTHASTSTRPDLKDQPILNTDLHLFVDDSSTKNPQTGKNQVSFAVVTETYIVSAERLQGNLSAPAAELYALTKACQLAEGKTVNVYTDSQYAFSTCHHFARNWANCGMVTSTPITQRALIEELLKAKSCQKPSYL